MSVYFELQQAQQAAWRRPCQSCRNANRFFFCGNLGTAERNDRLVERTHLFLSSRGAEQSTKHIPTHSVVSTFHIPSLGRSANYGTALVLTSASTWADALRRPRPQVGTGINCLALAPYEQNSWQSDAVQMCGNCGCYSCGEQIRCRSGLGVWGTLKERSQVK